MKQSWEIKKLGEVCSIMMGISPSSHTYNDMIGLPFFQGNADFGKTHPNVRVFCSAPIRVANVKDILISVRAPIGAINIADRTCCIGRGLAAITGGKDVLNSFIYHALVSNKEKLVAQGTGSTFKSIGRTALYELLIPIPPRIEQERIVAELDCLSSVIEKQKEQLKELDNLAQSIFYTMFGDPISNEKGWVVKKLGDVCNIVGGSTPKRTESTFWENGTYPWFTIEDIRTQGRYISDTKQKITEIAWKKLRVIPKDSILLCCTASIGEYALAKIPLTTNQQFNSLIIKNKDTLQPVFLMYVSSTFKEILLNMSGKATINFVSAEKVKNIKLLVPPLSLQQEFASKIEAIEKQKELIKQSIAETETLFNSRMDYYFN